MLNRIMFYIFIIIFLPFLVAWFGGWRKVLQSGNEAYWNHNFEAATEAFHQLTLDKPNYSTAFYNLGTALYKNGKYQKAAIAFQNSIMKSSSDNEAAAYYNLGNAQFQMHDLNAAIDSYKHSLRLDPNNTDAKHNLAMALELLNKQEQNVTQQMESSKEQESQENTPDQLSKSESQQFLENLSNNESLRRQEILKQQLNTGYRREKDW